MSRFIRLYILLAVGLLATLAMTALVGGLGSVRADTSGPNATDYVWIDNNAPDPVTDFNWMDATGGTLIPNASFQDDGASSNDDDGWVTVGLPFTFNFFGTDYTQVDVSTNGFLSFDIDSDCNDNYNWDDSLGDELGNPIPHTDVDCDGDSGWGGNPLIAPWFDDLDPGECGKVYYDTFGDAPDRMFVVEFDDVCHNDCDDCAAGEGITFETILFEGSNDIKFQYQDTFFGTGDEDISEENNGGTATTGINKDGSTGLLYSWADTVLTDGLAVLYTPSGLQCLEKYNEVQDICVSLEPKTDSNTVGDEHTVTASLSLFENGVPMDPLVGQLEGISLYIFVIKGPNAGERINDVTDSEGKLALVYTGAGGEGTDKIGTEVCLDEQGCTFGVDAFIDGCLEDPDPCVFTFFEHPTCEGSVDDQFLCDFAEKDWTGAVLAATPTPTPTPTPSPTPTAVAGVVQLPTTGGTPSDGGPGALPWLAAIAGAIALIGSGSAWFAYQRRRIR